MIIKSLEQTPIADIASAINTAFADYVIPFQITEEQLKCKMTSEDVDISLSFGVFEEDEMVAIMLHGVRVRGGIKVVYNAATGVSPKFRRRGLIGKMYKALNQKLAEIKAHEMVLEVIENNLPAISVYKKEGYTVARRLVCYQGLLHDNLQKNESLKIERLDAYDVHVLKSFGDVNPSWQNEWQSVDNAPEQHQVFGAYLQDQLVGHIVFNPEKRRVIQIAVDIAYRRMGVGRSLLMKMSEEIKSKQIFVYNIDEEALSCILFFKKFGLEPKVAQYEMRKDV